jgi:MGT family glycosyltransferase
MVEMLAPAVPALNAARARMGLGSVDGLAAIHDACALSLVATPREFEVDMPMPANVRFVGPILDGPPLLAGADDVSVVDGPDPLVLVSFSTSYQAQLPVLQAVVDALAELAIRVVVTTGPSLAVDAVAPRGNTTVARFVGHDRLLAHASLVVTHAGLGTVMTALSHGVPLLCLPLGRDQFYNAAQVEQLGAGRTLLPGADDPAIAGAVRELLDSPTVRDGAKRVARIIASYGGAATAVDELERLAQTREVAR